jgi:integrase
MKQSVGYSYISDIKILKHFSQFTLKYTITNHALSKELVVAWIEKRPNERDATRRNRIGNLRQFAIYLCNLGYEAYIPVCRVKINHNAYAPYIFTTDELRCFFTECDNIKPRPLSNKHLMFPVLYRLLYGSGLRISEAIALKLKDVDLKRGTITIRGSKFDKDRLIPLSSSMTRCMENYFSKIHAVSTPGDYFFMKRDRKAIAYATVYSNFRKILWKSGTSHGGKGRGPRLHDFRHTFAVHSLGQMVQQKVELYCALPFLSTYLGHASLAATERYLRLTEEAYPGILDAVSRTCAYIFPEVKCR